MEILLPIEENATIFLVNKAGGCDNEGASNYVGYSRVKDGKAGYMLIDYNEPFVDPFPGK